jgi:uncharacterized protein YdeI (YjbR/CyaY-like superfamily)
MRYHFDLDGPDSRLNRGLVRVREPEAPERDRGTYLAVSRSGSLRAGRATEVTAPREVVVPPDFDGALAADPQARRAFEALNYSNRQRIVLGIEGAKPAETRQQRVEKAMTDLRGGRVQP